MRRTGEVTGFDTVRGIDSVHSRMKDPEWRDFLLRIEEEFARMMLKSIRRERERVEKR